MDPCDVRMIQVGENLGFELEPVEAIWIVCERLGEDLNRDLAVQLGIGGLIDLSHAPLADEGGHVVMADSGADCEGHRVLSGKPPPFYAQVAVASRGAQNYPDEAHVRIVTGFGRDASGEDRMD